MLQKSYHRHNIQVVAINLFFLYSGLLVFARPCGVIIHVEEMVQGESTHDVAHALYELHDRGCNMDVCVYDNACHLDTTIVKNVPSLRFLEFAIDRFHQVWLITTYECSTPFLL